MKGTVSTIFRQAAHILIVILLSGCASMNAPDSDKISINSIPAGAKVYDGANLLGTTPMTHTFKRDTFQKKTLTLRKEGYKSQDLLLGTTLAKEALWNLAFITTTMGVTSWGIDAANGNMVQYHPDSYLIDLEKRGRPESARIRRAFSVFVLSRSTRTSSSGTSPRATASICGPISRYGRKSCPPEIIKPSLEGCHAMRSNCSLSAIPWSSTRPSRSYEKDEKDSRVQVSVLLPDKYVLGSVLI